MIETGQRAPDFSLPGTVPGDDSIETYRLSDHADEGLVVLSFYLFDFHPRCTRQACSLRDLAWFDLRPDTTVFGISTDRAFSHRAFADRYDLDFALLSDSDGSVSEAYGVLYDEFEGHKRVAKRAAFVVDDDRTVRYAWSTDDASQQPDWREVAAAARAVAEPA